MDKTGLGAKPMHPSYRSEARMRQLSHVLMSRPEYFSISEARNHFSRPDSSVDLPLALKQWENLREIFRRVRLEVSLLEPEPGLEDMCFTASQVFVGIDREDRSFAIPSRMLHRSRRDEAEYCTRWLSLQGYRIIDLGLEGEDFFEGASDLIWNPDWESIWAGFGHRSTQAAIDQFSALMQEIGFEVRKLELVDPYFYNLNLCLAPLAPEALLIYPGAFAPKTLAHIRGWATTYEVTREEAVQFACNGVSVNGFYIAPRLTTRLERILAKEGIEPICVDLSEFQKAGGSVASLKILLP